MFNPGVQNRAGEILAAYISDAGNTIAKSISDVRKAEAKKEVILGQLDAHYQAGTLSPEDYQAANSGNLNKALSLLAKADASYLLQHREQQQQMANRRMQLDENQFKLAADKSDRLGQIVQGRLADGTMVDINAGTGQIVGGVQKQLPAPNDESVRWITDPTNNKRVGYQVWQGNKYSDPHNIPAPNPMESFLATQAAGTPAAAGTAQPGTSIQSTIEQLQKEKAEHIGALAGGDKRFGITQMNSRENRIKEIDAQLQSLSQSSATAAPSVSVAKVALQPSQSPQTVPSIASKADFDALPSGAEYINAKTGQRFRKP